LIAVFSATHSLWQVAAPSRSDRLRKVDGEANNSPSKITIAFVSRSILKAHEDRKLL
jgi:hypothetical protein